jgi:GNAT superfamily N-acetyltransferase
MEIQVRERALDDVERYASISIAFEVRRVLDCTLIDGGLGGMHLTERVLARSYLKDYDTVEEDHPASWPKRFDVSRWVWFEAQIADDHVGGAALAYDTPAVQMLEGRSDLAVLWDVRVAASARGLGVGHALFQAAEAWARRHHCTQFKIETQNVNVPACRFYARQGCSLGGINRFAYPDLPHEVQLLWYKSLAQPAPAVVP